MADDHQQIELNKDDDASGIGAGHETLENTRINLSLGGDVIEGGETKMEPPKSRQNNVGGRGPGMSQGSMNSTTGLD